jgi:hypothetical protein
MALPRFRAAVASGNWSNPATWNDGILPQPNDIVFLNSFNVLIDTDISVYQIRNDAQNYTSFNSFTYLTSNNTPEGIADGSDTDQFYNNWFPFGNTSTIDTSPNPSYANPRWWTYEYPNQEPILLGEYRFNGYNTNHPYNPRDWKFQGWDDINEVWVDLDTQTDVFAPYNGGATFIGDISSNTTAYYKYRLIVFKTRDGENQLVNVTFVKFFEKNVYKTTTIPGGVLTISDSSTWNTQVLNQLNVNVTTTIYSRQGNSHLITCSIGANDTVNFNLRPFPAQSYLYASIFVSGGSGVYNLNGDFIWQPYANFSGSNIIINAPCEFNIVGFVKGGGHQGTNSAGIRLIGNGATLNIIGNVEGASGISSSCALFVSGASDVNITGNVSGTLSNETYGSNGIEFSNSSGNLTIVGNVVGSPVRPGNLTAAATRNGMLVYNANSLHITGNIIGGADLYPNDFITSYYGLYIQTVPTFTVIGAIEASETAQGIVSNVSIFQMKIFPYDHRLSGPFISGSSGRIPHNLPYFKLLFNYGLYHEYRDVDLNPTQLVSPSTIINSPNPADVRQGVTYANANYTGTLIIPPANRVSVGVPVDNTVGTAILVAEDVWNAQTSAMNTEGSIGKRLKNASTVDSTGDQLTSLL